MPTVKVNLSTTEYVKVNTAFNPMVLQCLRDSVRITLSELKPAVGNAVFHSLSGKDAPLPFNSIDTNVWALAVTDTSSLIVSETAPMPVIAGVGINKDAWGVQKTSFDKSLFHGLFTFDVSPYMWIIEEDGPEVVNSLSTRATSVNGFLSLKSGASAGNSCIVESRRHPRYQPDRGIKWAASVGFKDASLDGILKAGVIVGEENGVYFKTKGDGKLYACVLNDNIEIEELITFPFNIDITVGNNYDIQIQWRGVGFVRFFAANPVTGYPELVHEMNFLNSLDEAVLLRNPAMSVSYHAENITQEVSLWSGCADVSSEGGIVDREQYGEHSADRSVTSGGTGGGVIALRNPLLAPNGKTNTRDINLARVTVTADKKSTFKIYQTRDASAITAGSWDAHREGSFVEVNITFSDLDFTKLAPFSTFKPAAGQTLIKDNPAPDKIDFYLIHGDHIVIACTAGTNIAAEVSIEWGEEI
jgi:hypothetical protein